jgi:hypothetical protein
MTSITPPAGGVSSALSTIELRVISNLLQAQGQGGGNSNADQLSTLRNDQAFELGIVPPIVPGS